MDRREVYKKIFDEAYNYLLSFDEVNESIIGSILMNFKATNSDKLQGALLKMNLLSVLNKI